MSPAVTDTKQKLIDTALELIWKSSYGSVSVDDICKAAGVKKGSFYHFFPSKLDLALAAVDGWQKDLKEAYNRIFSAATPPVERFAKLADFICEGQQNTVAQYGKVCGCPNASLGAEMAGQEDAIRVKFEEVAHRQERYYENALRDMVAEGSLPADINVTIKAQEIYAYILGQQMVARIQNDLEPLKRDLKKGLMRTLGVPEKQTVEA